MALIEVKLRPTTPWRSGHRTGDRERVDVIYHSDALYSAITHAMGALGWMEAWLDATARATEPAVRFSSLFPFIGKTRLITPPKSGAGKLAPLGGGRQPEQSLYTVSLRSAAAVDRLTGATEPHRTACLEFAPNAGMWGVFEATPEWEPKVKSAFRLLADSGFGGERSRGWGRASEPIFSTASALFPDKTPNGDWWLLGVFSPASTDEIDWDKSEHTITVRGGWTSTGAKRQLRMIEEGSVLSAVSLTGRSVDVAPEGAPHPAYRNGHALAVPLPTTKAAPEPIEPQLPPPDPEPVQPQEGNAAIAASAVTPDAPEPHLPPPDPEPELPPVQEPEPELPQPFPDPEPMQMQEGHALEGASADAPEPPTQPEPPANPDPLPSRDSDGAVTQTSEQTEPPANPDPLPSRDSDGAVTQTSEQTEPPTQPEPQGHPPEGASEEPPQ